MSSTEFRNACTRKSFVIVFGDSLFVYNFECNLFAFYCFYCFFAVSLLCLCSDVGHYFLQGVMLVAESLNGELVDLNNFKEHQNQEKSNDELHGLVNVLNIILVVNDLHGVNDIGGANLGVLRPYAWFTSSLRPLEFLGGLPSGCGRSQDR